MAANKQIRFGPSAIGTGITNFINPPTLNANVGLSGSNTSTYIIVRHIRVTNKSAILTAVSFWIGATLSGAAGTEFAFNSTAIPANSYVDWYGMVRLDTADFLTGIASGLTALTFEAEGEIGIL
jgi:hypothetical protein